MIRGRKFSLREQVSRRIVSRVEGLRKKRSSYVGQENRITGKILLSLEGEVLLFATQWNIGSKSRKHSAL